MDTPTKVLTFLRSLEAVVEVFRSFLAVLRRFSVEFSFLLGFFREVPEVN